MATVEQVQEIANRGIQDRLSPEKRAKFDELVKRGIITLPSGEATTQSQAQQPTQVQQPPQEPQSKSDMAMGILQLIASAGNAVAGPIAGGVAGTVQALNPLAGEGAGGGSSPSN